MLRLRILAYGIDWMLVYLLTYLILQNFPVYKPWSETISLFIFVVYNIILLLSNEGQTIGKSISKIKVFDNQNDRMNIKISFLIRELAKGLYLLTGIVGITAMMINLFLYSVKNITLQDVLGQTSIGWTKDVEDE